MRPSHPNRRRTPGLEGLERREAPSGFHAGAFHASAPAPAHHPALVSSTSTTGARPGPHLPIHSIGNPMIP
jgi:hypothetical protein